MSCIIIPITHSDPRKCFMFQQHDVKDKGLQKCTPIRTGLGFQCTDGNAGFEVRVADGKVW
jgi:hypothetical protein